MKPFLLLSLLFTSIVAKTQIVSTDFGTGTATVLTSYPGYNNIGTAVASFGGSGSIVNNITSSGYAGASGGSNVRLSTGESFSVTFNTGDNLLLGINFAYITQGNTTLTDPYLEYSIVPGVYLPLNLISFTNAANWVRINSSPMVVLPNTDITLRWRAVGLSSSYKLHIDDVNFSNLTVLPITAPQLTADNKGDQLHLRWEKPGHPYARLELQRTASATSLYETIFSTNEAAGIFSHTDRKPLQQGAYYRLLIISNEGDSAYSKQVRVAAAVSELTMGAIYPNPVTGNNINFRLNGPVQADLYCRILDFRGDLLYQTKRAVIGAQKNYSIQPNGLKKGIHYLEVTSGSYRQIQQFVKD